MLVFFLFILSGIGIAVITLAKRVELKRKKTFFLLKAIARGEERAKSLYHEALHFYSDGKHKFSFFVRKQLPLRIKSYVNKFIIFIKERGEERFGNIRNSRLINKKEGISEFFKNISEVEKGGGELHDEIYVEPTIDSAPLAYRITRGAPPAKVRRKRSAPRKKLEIVEEV